MALTPNVNLRTRRRRSASRALLVSGALLGVVVVGAPAGAQTTPGGGPFASGTVTSVSGDTVELESEFQDDAVTVTLDAATTYQRIDAVAADTIAAGDCVRISGSGNAKKGIKASTVSLTEASGDECEADNASGGGQGFPGGGGGFPGGGEGFPGGGDGQTPPSLPEGATPPSGGGNGQGVPGGRTGGGTSAVGTVTSASSTGLVVKGSVITIPTKQGSAPKIANNKKVKVTLSDKTTITATVEGAATDVIAGTCMTANGTGDSSAIVAESVVVSTPDEDGACGIGTGFGGGPPQNQT